MTVVREARSKEIHLRVSPRELEQIERRAGRASSKRSDYMIRAALGQITDPASADERLEDLTERVERLERWQQLSA